MSEETRRPAPPCWSGEAAPLLRLFHHQLYEYGRGVRALFLMTVAGPELALARGKLEARAIAHFTQPLGGGRANLFFGRPAFVEVARALVTRPLNALTAEEDFMLGTLLGYDGEQQCRRFLQRSSHGAAATLAMAAE